MARSYPTMLLRLFIFAMSLIMLCLTITRLTSKSDADESVTWRYSSPILSLPDIVFAFLGFHGSIRQHSGSLKAFTVCAGIQGVKESLITLGTVGQIYMSEIKIINLKLDQGNYNWLVRSKNPSVIVATREWDSIQDHECCGIDGPHDWDKYRPAYIMADSYPDSCYKPTGISRLSNVQNVDETTLIHEGCRKKVVREVGYLVSSLGWVLSFFAFFMLLLAGSAWWLRRRVIARAAHNRVMESQEPTGSLYPPVVRYARCLEDQKHWALHA